MPLNIAHSNGGNKNSFQSCCIDMKKFSNMKSLLIISTVLYYTLFYIILHSIGAICISIPPAKQQKATMSYISVWLFNTLLQNFSYVSLFFKQTNAPKTKQKVLILIDNAILYSINPNMLKVSNTQKIIIL